jgi:glycerophosphoryl diester phosphodiesterase
MRTRWLATFLAVTVPAWGATPFVVAHRGCSHDAPEETAPAYVCARDLGADYLEGDLHRTRDGKLVLIHDDTLERTTDLASFPELQARGAEVGSFTLEELRRLDAGSWFNRKHKRRAKPAYAGLRILTLEDLIAIAEGGTGEPPGLFLEFKSPEKYPGIEAEAVAILDRAGWIGTSRKVIFQSFDPASVERLAQLAPAVPRLLLARDGGNPEEARNAGATMVGPYYLRLSRKEIRAAHDAGLAVIPYTVNSRLLMKLFFKRQVDGIFTDRPDVAIRQKVGTTF